MGIAPGDVVHVIEHRGEQQIVYNALVAGISMRDDMRGTKGEPSIRAAFIAPMPEARQDDWELTHATLTMPGIVHISHRDWIERRASLGYEEMPRTIA